MKVKRFSMLRDKDPQRCINQTNSEYHFGKNGDYYSKLAQMPIKDLAILSFYNENDLKKNFTGQLQWVDYSIVEIMLNTRSKIRNLGKHKISSFDDALYILIQYNLTEIPITDDPDFISVTIAADILNLREGDIIRIAENEDELFGSESDNCFVRWQWIIDTYKRAINDLGIPVEIIIKNNMHGKVEILIERELE